MIYTDSLFYYGYTVTSENFYLDIDEGGGEIAVELDVGSYSLTEFLVMLQSKLNTYGTLNYVVSVNRTTRIISISGDAVFSILALTGTHSASSMWSEMGFNAVDKTGSSSYVGDVASGDFYRPQFKLQDWIDKEHSQKSVDASVKKTASGKVEVVRFGLEKFYQFSLKFATNIPQDNVVLKNNATGVEDLTRFMQFLITKSPIEFMKDASDPNTFDTVLLESTPFDSNGIGYELIEMYDKSLPGYFDTGKLRFRVIE